MWIYPVFRPLRPISGASLAAEFVEELARAEKATARVKPREEGVGGLIVRVRLKSDEHIHSSRQASLSCSGWPARAGPSRYRTCAERKKGLRRSLPIPFSGFRMG